MTEAVSYVTDRSPCRPNRRPLHPQPKVIWATMMEDILINHNAEVIRPMSWMIVHICAAWAVMQFNQVSIARTRPITVQGADGPAATVMCCRRAVTCCHPMSVSPFGRIPSKFS